jgi:hypothetical protein
MQRKPDAYRGWLRLVILRVFIMVLMASFGGNFRKTECIQCSMLRIMFGFSRRNSFSEAFRGGGVACESDLIISRCPRWLLRLYTYVVGWMLFYSIRQTKKIDVHVRSLVEENLYDRISFLFLTYIQILLVSIIYFEITYICKSHFSATICPVMVCPLRDV